MSAGPEPRPREARATGLTFRVIALLTLALLPMGLVAVYQGREYQREAMLRSELALLALTERAAAAEAEVIAGAIGVARALGSVGQSFLHDPDLCEEHLDAVIAADPRFAFAGFVAPDGHLACSTDAPAEALRVTDQRLDYLQNPRGLVWANPPTPMTGEWVIVVSEPVFDGDTFLGSMSVSVPHRVLSEVGNRDAGQGARSPRILTFNAAGEVLAGASEAAAGGDLPRVDLAGFADDEVHAWSAPNREGELRAYAVTPIVPGQVYALGIWDPGLLRPGGLPPVFLTMVFPLLMWAMSLVVASFAMHRLVLVHVQSLRSRMQGFGRSRTLAESPRDGSAPAELRDMNEAFMAMAESVLRDEARLEDAVRERNILLKEIHHRVKNNLQLLSSITSMKRRSAASPEARAVLRSLGDRILGLAAIHRNLYLARDVSAVEARFLVEDIAAYKGLMSGAGRIHMDIDPVRLVPQQAVPFSLLVSEALGGGEGDAAAPGGGAGPVTVEVRADDERMVTLRMETPVRTAGADPSEAAISENLLGAFADQLGGSLSRTEPAPGRVRIEVSFRAYEAAPETLDY